MAIVAADMILLRDDLGAVPDAIALARATFRTIRRKLAWAFCYNVLAIPLAAFGLLNPLVAAATTTLSSVFVVWNSLRLRRFSAPSAIAAALLAPALAACGSAAQSARTAEPGTGSAAGRPHPRRGWAA